MKQQWKLIVTIIIMTGTVFFALQNVANVEINLFWAKFTVPLVLVILLSILLGVILGLLSSLSGDFQSRFNTKSLETKVNELQVENERLNKKYQEYVDQQVKFVQSKDQEIKRLGLELVNAQSKASTAVDTLTESSASQEKSE